MPKQLQVIYESKKTKRRKTYPFLSALIFDKKIKDKPINIYKHLQRNGFFATEKFIIHKK
jgi:hypothetical protein